MPRHEFLTRCTCAAISILYQARRARVAELVDALDSGSSVRKDFRVQVPGSASLLLKIDVYFD